MLMLEKSWIGWGSLLGVESYADVQGGMVCFDVLCSDLVKSEEDAEGEDI